jgi:fatty acid desaturase
MVAALSLIAGIRMLTVSIGYLRWRTGRARLRDAPVLSDGRLAPLQVRKVAAVVLMITAIALGTLATMWGSQLVMLVIVISGVWIVGPAWWVHLLVSTTEAKR